MNDLVTVDTVCARYGIEQHAAGRILHRIPHFKIAGKLCAHEMDLHEYEMSLMQYPVQTVKKSAGSHTIPRRK